MILQIFKAGKAPRRFAIEHDRANNTRCLTDDNDKALLTFTANLNVIGNEEGPIGRIEHGQKYLHFTPLSVYGGSICTNVSHINILAAEVFVAKWYIDTFGYADDHDEAIDSEGGHCD